MKHIKLTILLFVLILFSCNQENKKSHSSDKTFKQEKSKIVTETEKIQKLIRQLYEWHETKSSKFDFDLVADNQDSLYIKLDLKKHNQRLTELRQTNFFSDQFLDNYNKIALTIDKGLKSKKIEYFVGELPPYGNDANPWCSCQDNPDNYWQNLTIDKISIENNNATFIWTWGDNFEYKAKAIKENGEWKITYLQGFDFEEFIPS